MLGENLSDGVAFSANGYRYELFKNREGYSLRTKKDSAETEEIFFFSENPVCLRIKMSGRETEKEYFSEYERLEAEGNAILATAVLETVTESVLEVTDRYSLSGELLHISRTVTVKRAGRGDEGFASVFSLEYQGKASSFEDMEYFVPGVWNKNSELDSPEGLASSYDCDAILIKDTRAGLPMITGRVKSNGETLSIGRLNPEISSDVSDFGGERWLTDGEYLCGSVGALLRKKSSVALAYVYPAAEEPYGYFSGGESLKRFHPISEGFSSSFTVSLRSDKTSDYNGAMMDSYISYFSQQDIEYFDADLGSAYTECIKTMLQYYDTKITPDMKICGLPYGCYVMDGHVESDLTMEMGFVGMEISAAYQLMRYGYAAGDSQYINSGEAMADMWAEYSGNPSGTLKVYLLSNGVFDRMPCYLRRMTDGMEGMLDCCNLAQSKGLDKPEWFEIVENYADFLVREQNSDGSWYRAYDYGGNVFSDKSVTDYKQYYDKEGINPSSKNSTPIPIRFLVRMYEYTGEEKYLNAAKRGAEYVITELVPMGKYAGATVDGHERTDKETGVFAMYGMNALYSVTGEEKYLNAAKQAAVYAASWMMLNDYKAAVSTVESGEYFINNASVTGQSLITSGHSTVDGFMAYTYYEYFKLYVWTGEDFYYDFAKLAQNNSKRNLNYDGRLGYASKGLCLEAINLADFYFITSGSYENDNPGVWLPWCSIAHIEPISVMQDVFGAMSVEEANELSKDALLSKITAYGAGGHPKA